MKRLWKGEKNYGGKQEASAGIEGKKPGLYKSSDIRKGIEERHRKKRVWRKKESENAIGLQLQQTDSASERAKKGSVKSIEGE